LQAKLDYACTSASIMMAGGVLPADDAFAMKPYANRDYEHIRGFLGLDAERLFLPPASLKPQRTQNSLFTILPFLDIL
jgi:hypothetical protein